MICADILNLKMEYMEVSSNITILNYKRALFVPWGYLALQSCVCLLRDHIWMYSCILQCSPCGFTGTESNAAFIIMSPFTIDGRPIQAYEAP